MANRQYVGARYVPKFADPVEWDNVRQYEPLTIVTHLGNSFTSKKPVPAGVDIGNTEYWVNTGNYNEQIERLVEEVKNSSTKSIVLIGDSYGTNNGGGVVIANPLPVVIKQYLGIADDKYKYSFQNGAGFANQGFINQLNSFSADKSVTDVYVMGGWNDEIGRGGITADDVKNAMVSFYSSAMAKFPSCKIHLLFISWGGYHKHTWYSGLVNARTIYRDCASIGFIYHGEAENVMHNRDLMIDTDSHPNQQGVNKLAEVISCIINGGSPRYSYEASYNADAFVSENYTIGAGYAFSVAEEITESGEKLLLYNNTNGVMNINVKGEAQTLVLNGTTIDLGERPQKLIIGRQDNVSIPATVSFVHNNALVVTVNGAISFKEDGHVYLKPNFYTEDYTNYNAKTIQFDLALINAQCNFSSPVAY